MAGVRTIVAESWSHLCDVLFEGFWRPEIGRHRSHCAYKGLSRADYELTTSLYRLGGDVASVERHLLRNFRKYGVQSFEKPIEGRLWNWLALAQHHGLPTRLLDWTYSPLVAAHFATAGRGDHAGDSAVVAIDYVRVVERLPERLRKALDLEGGDVWTAELLEKELPNWSDLEALNDGEPVLLFFEPPAVDQRIVNQYALFSLLSDATATMQDYLARHPELAYRVVIPHRLCQEVRDKLDQANVNERTLFPGLDGLSRWLARHYSPADGAPTPASENESPVIEEKQG